MTCPITSSLSADPSFHSLERARAIFRGDGEVQQGLRRLACNCSTQSTAGTASAPIELDSSSSASTPLASVEETEEAPEESSEYARSPSYQPRSPDFAM